MGKPAARATDGYTCSIHGGGATPPPAQTSARIGGQFAARLGDKTVCGSAVTKGATKVNICGAPAARMLDTTADGAIVTGFKTVNIGD